MRLYRFKICPFVEATEMVLAEKNLPYERIYVDIRKKTDWFLKLSPMGKVPMLEVDGHIIFETSVINEYLDSISGGNLFPSNPILKAENKSWITWCHTLIFDAYSMTLAPSKEEFDQKRIIVDQRLASLEKQLTNQPFFNGKEFMMIDIAYAPQFKRFECLSRLYDIDILSKYPKLQAWSNNVLVRQSVKAGFASNFDDELKELYRIKGSFLALPA